MQKECEICGTWFGAVRSNRKYCDKYQQNSEKARHRINTAIAISMDRMDDAYPMMYLAMVINESDPDLGRDLCHALHAIYYREEAKQLWKK